jgi:LysM repeat protein
LRRPPVFLLAIALLAARPALAGIELAGTTGANFLSIGPGASLIGMGGTGIAGYPDLSAMAWNAASLGLMNESQLMLTHMPLPNSASQEWMSFGGRMGEAPTRWALSGRYEGDGSFKAYDALGNLTGTFNASSLALGVNAARALDRHTVVGMGAKFVNENLGAVSGYGGTFDIGVIYRAGPLSLGAAAQNMGGSMKYDSLAYSMPLNFGTGLSLRSVKTGLSASVDFNHPNAYYDDVRTGAEWMWKDHMALRIGYRQELNAPSDDPMNSVSAGFGFGGHGMWLDYGFVASGDGTSQQRITLRVSPKDWGFLSADVDNPNGSEGSAAASAPPARQPSAASSGSGTPASVAPAAAATSTTSGAVASAPSSSTSVAGAPAPAAALPVAAPITTSSASSTAPATKATPTSSSSASASTRTVSATSSTPAPAPAAVMPPPVAPIPSAPLPSKSSTSPVKSEPATPAPELTTLVPVTPPAVPAPKPVAASRPTTLPGVSAPAPQLQPSEAPVTTPANDGSAAAAPAKGKRAEASAPAAAPAVAATPAVASAPVVESAVGTDGKPVRIHVKKDETLESIAKRFGTTKAALMMENNLVTEKLHLGQELKIPNHR